MPKPQTVPLLFPLKGIDESKPYASKAGPVAVRQEHVLNVRPHDTIEERARGGQRTGISKYISSVISAGNRIQLLDQLDQAVPLQVSASWGSQYAHATSYDDLSKYNCVAVHPDGNAVAFGGAAGDPQLRIWAWDATNGFGAILDSVSETNLDVRAIDWHPSGDHLAVLSNDSNSVRVYSWDGSTLSGEQTPPSNPSNLQGGDLQKWALRWNAAGTRLAAGGVSSPHIFVWEFSAGSFGSKIADPSSLPAGDVTGIAWHPDGDYIALSVYTNAPSDAHLVYNFSDAGGFGSKLTAPSSAFDFTWAVAWSPDGNAVAWGYNGSESPNLRAWPFDGSNGSFGTNYSDPPNNGNTIDGIFSIEWSPSGDFVLLMEEASPNVRIISWSAGWGDHLADPSTLLDTTNLLSGDAAGEARWHPDENAAFACGDNGGSSASIMDAWAFQPSEVNPQARETKLLAVAGGSVFQSDAPPSTMSQVNQGDQKLKAQDPVRGSQAFSNYFFCDGRADSYHYLDFSDDTLKDWSSNLSAGSLPVGTDDATKACRIIALYRGRVALSGLQEDPHNWFLSKAGDPFDWDYSPATTSPTQAVAGNASDAGEIGDIVTALAPLQDDIMMIGCRASLWIMRGDPAAGGQIDNVSRQVGIVGPDAWTWDTSSTLYFMGPEGLYRLPASAAAPTLISQGRMDAVFAQLDVSANLVRLIYDNRWRGVHIFIQPANAQASSPADHYFWDARTDSFWRDQYPVQIGPNAMTLFIGDRPEDRAVLLGGWDGYVRFFDEDATDDDGTAIDSFCWLPLVHPNLPMGQFQLSDMQMHLDGDGDGTELAIYRGKTPEQAATAGTAAHTKTLTAGRNVPIRKRLRANALGFRLRNNNAGETWAYENGAALVAGVGRQRAKL